MDRKTGPEIATYNAAEAIETLLRAERDIEAGVETARQEASAIREQAYADAQAIADRVSERIEHLGAHTAKANKRDIRELEAQTAALETSPVSHDDADIITRAAKLLADELVRGKP